MGGGRTVAMTDVIVWPPIAPGLAPRRPGRGRAVQFDLANLQSADTAPPPPFSTWKMRILRRSRSTSGGTTTWRLLVATGYAGYAAYTTRQKTDPWAQAMAPTNAVTPYMMTVAGLGDGWDGAHPLGSLSGGGAPEGQAWTTWTTSATGLPDLAEDGCAGELTVSYLKEPRWDVRACRRHTDRPCRTVALPRRQGSIYWEGYNDVTQWPSAGSRPTMTDTATGQTLVLCAQHWTGSQAPYGGQDYSNFATAGFRLWAPRLPYQLPDLAVDCDCPSPWGNSRIVWAGGIPHWVSRSDASGSVYAAATVRHPYQRTRTEALFSATDTWEWDLSARLADRGREPLPLNSAAAPLSVGRGFSLYADDLPGLIPHVPFLSSWHWCEIDHRTQGNPYYPSAGPTVSPGGYSGPRNIGIAGTDSYGNSYVFALGASCGEVRYIERASVMPPPCWPWDVPRLALGDDDSTVRYVGSCGWVRPPHGQVPADLVIRDPDSVTRSGATVTIMGRNVATDDYYAMQQVACSDVRVNLGQHSFSSTYRIWCPATGDQIAAPFSMPSSSSAYPWLVRPPFTVSLPSRCAGYPITIEIDMLARNNSGWGEIFTAKRVVYDL